MLGLYPPRAARSNDRPSGPARRRDPTASSPGVMLILVGGFRRSLSASPASGARDGRQSSEIAPPQPERHSRPLPPPLAELSDHAETTRSARAERHHQTASPAGQLTAGLELRRQAELRYAFAPSICGSCATLGSHSSRRGRYQFHLPRSFIVAGSSTARTIVASIRIATDRPTPISLKSTELSVAKTANTATMTIAALVTVTAVARMPCDTASSVRIPRSTASRIRLRMNTW